MPEPLRTQVEPLDDFDFAGEMKNLVSQAEAKASGAVRMDRNDLLLALGQMLRPLAFELESVKRQNAEMAATLAALGKSNASSQPAAASTSQAIENISQQLQRIGSVESANQKLFDALHSELKGYKDNFLFDALQKPFIRDLVSLFDDFTAVHEQALARLDKLRAAPPPPEKSGKSGDRKRENPAPPGGEDEEAFLKNLAGNVENQLHHMIEVFLRMDVILSRTAAGAPIDKKTHRTVAFEPAATPDDDGLVGRSVKPGFTWRERAIRPEEIVARRWKPASTAPPDPAPVPVPAATESTLP